MSEARQGWGGRRAARLGALGLLLALGAWLGWTLLRGEDAAALPVLGLERDVPILLRATGSVEADRLARMGFDMPGTIARIAVRVGDRVEAGQELALLDNRLQIARLDSTRAALAEAELQVLVRQASVAGAVAVLDQRRRTQSRTTALRLAGHAAMAIAEDAELGVATAEAELRGARHAHELARAQVETARSEVQAARVVLDRHTLRAPFSGIVIARHQEVGEIADGRSPLLTLVDPDSVWLRAYVGEDFAGGVEEGQRAEIVLRARPSEPLPGRVARIDREVDRATEDRRFNLAFEIIPPAFVLGEPAEIRIVTGVTREAVLIPERLIRNVRDGSGTVWVRAGGTLAERRVQLGRRHDDGRRELLGGLEPEEAVLAVRPRGWFGAGS
ncbi:efflux RND transporter periplasmic adaptor subunit [Falsiroseomonas selenitidurans]|uniref:Efflux RND transporter periplasmic adaptor subunit n=1 Tax=Falsiroseomonas selenitidurans TaxID=2716335 RepID=A0ABX1E1P4_9PROT|nr:efflux RND transporter periplasmic adaptor subunit [Falsiroseomonas selenitidurans]NKC31067.1 efflux RND transporter periplasmic adaptor subunit [Falsiroseomonas selenitidurans]